MRFGSVCSGIEAASVAWRPLGWEAAFFSEIEPFPSAVLAHHYPHVPNRGDMTAYEGWPDDAIDLLVGGTPCQSFSVAGLRKGMADPRGNLTLTFLAIAEHYKPAWILWENVPGVISDKTGALVSLLDGLEELGYIVDIDILDAQYFGLAQRRRRVFICGQHRDDLLKERTPSSALTIAQCLIEILHGICLAELRKYGSAGSASASAGLSADGVKRRISLFAIDRENACQKLLPHLIAALTKSSRGHGSSASASGGKAAVVTLEGRSTGSPAEVQYTLTEQSLSAALADLFDLMRSYTTSTATKTTTQTTIFTCSRAALLIARLIALSNPSHPCFWSAASSALTALKEFTAYARSASSDIFTDLEWLQPWSDFVGEAERTIESLGGIGVENFGEVFPVSEGLPGNPPPRREARQEVATTIRARPTGGGGLGTDFDLDGGLITDGIARCDTAGYAQRLDWETENFVATRDVAATLTRGAESHGKGGYAGRRQEDDDNLVAHSLRAEGFDASEDGTGRGTPLVPICFDTTQITSAANYSRPQPGDPCHPLAAGAHAPAVAIQAGALRENTACGPDGVGVQSGIAYTVEARAEVQAVQSS